MTHHDDHTRTVLNRILRDGGLRTDTTLYRSVLPEHMAPTDDPSVRALLANPDPSEAVVDEYGGGHVSTAAQLGPGLAFAEAEDHQWQAKGRVMVAVNLRDVLDQGGLVYPVESVITEKVWYCTLPSGSVRARVLP